MQVQYTRATPRSRSDYSWVEDSDDGPDRPRPRAQPSTVRKARKSNRDVGVSMDAESSVGPACASDEDDEGDHGGDESDRDDNCVGDDDTPRAKRPKVAPRSQPVDTACAGRGSARCRSTSPA